jgi:hypothetical protein
MRVLWLESAERGFQVYAADGFVAPTHHVGVQLLKSVWVVQNKLTGIAQGLKPFVTLMFWSFSTSRFSFSNSFLLSWVGCGVKQRPH